MINSQERMRILSIIFGIFLPCISWGTSILEAPESVSIEMASKVYLLRIDVKETVMSGDTPCGSRYHASIRKTIKGDLGEKKVTFGFWQNLEIGRRYKIFLKPIPTREGFIQMLRDRGSIDEVQRYVSACIDVMPKSYFFRADEGK